MPTPLKVDASRRAVAAIVTHMLRDDTSAANSTLRHAVHDNGAPDLLGSSVTMLKEAWQVYANTLGVDVVELAERMTNFYASREQRERERE